MALGEVILVAKVAAPRRASVTELGQMLIEVEKDEVVVIWGSPILPVNEVVAVIFNLRD